MLPVGLGRFGVRKGRNQPGSVACMTKTGRNFIDRKRRLDCSEGSDQGSGDQISPSTEGGAAIYKTSRT